MPDLDDLSLKSEFDEYIARLDETFQQMAGLSPYLLGDNLDADGLPIPDGVTSGEAINNLIQSARVRLGER